ncbi:polygalacturonase [Phtheirospermum japonicum]|uniref:endo-polygalacturonase n=1 Tax=Phtheirospermum japonicum TaxID=374723 RepID=A0A830BXJ4_9LAMI|nr:polygalacturonase [Phtheirospermum japonicum]
MSLENNFLPCFIISLLSLLSSCCTSSLIHNSPVDGYVQEESGYDFGAYPSYFGHFRGVNFENYSGKKKLHGLSDFKKFRRSLTASVTINVLDFGAKGDGNTDDTKAFQKAWTEACSSSGDVNFVVPQNKDYLLKPIRFSGPCTSDITVQISGNIIASDDRSDYSKDLSHWLVFDSVQNLIVKGGGSINGNGNIWWQNSCKINKANPCTEAPTALTFYRCTNLVVQNLKIENAQQMHVSFEKSKNVVASNIVVNAPENSPNTDGIHVTDTQNIQISSCTIGTGDDCISIVSGSQKVEAMGITCGPGHGISIGSLGSANAKEYVSDVVVNGAKLSGTTNGVRIKTWQGGSGSASNIKFQNIEMQNVENPIIIDQNYCDHNKPCKQQSSAVQVKNVVYQNITGTSGTDVAINFNCSKNHPCQGIVMQNVSLVAENGENAKAVCKNVEFANTGTLSSKFLNSESVSPGCP